LKVKFGDCIRHVTRLLNHKVAGSYMLSSRVNIDATKPIYGAYGKWLYVWEDFMVILGIVVKDSLTRVGQDIFAKMLNSTLQVPYKSIILVSDSRDSTDDFVKTWAEEHDKEVTVTKSNLYGYHRPTRATARQTAIDIFLNNFNDEWIMFVDDDVVLNDGWWQWVIDNKVLENPRVGEIWGLNYDTTPEREYLLKLLGINLKEYLIKKFEARGGTHDTLYRRKAIEGISIPPELHVYEDAYLHFYVKCRGWESVVNPVGIIHYHPVNVREEKERMKIAIQVAVKYGIIEYDVMKLINQGFEKRIMSYLSLLRPVLGFPLTLLVAIRCYGLKKGFIETIKRQYLKLWSRWQVLRNLKNARIPNICEAIGRK